MPRLFALDKNFPQPIVSVLTDFQVDATLVPLDQIDGPVNARRLGTAAREIVSPGDETWEKLPFYAAHAVDEVLILDPTEHAIHWLGLADGEYHPLERSGVIDLGPVELAERIDWP